ncbi:MAG: hypothetical protein SGJ19_17450 [Planctomycetia bacterium]|nr:hypothetical protein [Planctomycetia bacterium]
MPRWILTGGSDRLRRGVIGFHAPGSLLLQLLYRNRRERDTEQVGGEGLDVAFGDPRRAEIGVDVAGEHVLRLHSFQGFDIAGEFASSPLSGVKFVTHVAGEINVGRLPGLGFGVVKDQVFQLVDDPGFQFAVE